MNPRSITEAGFLDTDAPRVVHRKGLTMGRLRIMGRVGDRQIEWRQDDLESLVLAEHELAEWLNRPGHKAFGFKQSHLGAGKQITSFDSTLFEILLVPQMRGG